MFDIRVIAYERGVCHVRMRKEEKGIGLVNKLMGVPRKTYEFLKVKVLLG